MRDGCCENSSRMSTAADCMRASFWTSVSVLLNCVSGSVRGFLRNSRCRLQARLLPAGVGSSDKERHVTTPQRQMPTVITALTRNRCPDPRGGNSARMPVRRRRSSPSVRCCLRAAVVATMEIRPRRRVVAAPLRRCRSQWLRCRPDGFGFREWSAGRCRRAQRWSSVVARNRTASSCSAIHRRHSPC